MKYVVFQLSEIYMPVIIPEHITHKQIKLRECKVVSAGFFKEEFGIIKVSTAISESLKIGPHKRDKKLLEAALYNNSRTSDFLIYNYET